MIVDTPEKVDRISAGSSQARIIRIMTVVVGIQCSLEALLDFLVFVVVIAAEAP
jgi:hypothetical protein